MSINVHIHKTHRQYTHGHEVVEVDGKTVGNCLDDLSAKYPGIKNKLFDTKGRLRNIIEIYLNAESAFPDELLKPVNDGDEISITILLAGG